MPSWTWGHGMNLVDMVRRSDRSLAVTGDVEIDKRNTFVKTWRGVRLAPGALLRLKDVLRFYPLATMPDTCGWYACPVGEGKRHSRLEVALTGLDQDDSLQEIVVKIDATPALVQLPWVFDGGAESQ